MVITFPSIHCCWPHIRRCWERDEGVPRSYNVKYQGSLTITRVMSWLLHAVRFILKYFHILRKKNSPAEEPIFQCIGMLAAAVGPNLTKLLHDQLDLMFAYGLSEPLRQALMNIAKYIPPLLKTIQGAIQSINSVCFSHHWSPQSAFSMSYLWYSLDNPTDPWVRQTEYARSILSQIVTST